MTSDSGPARQHNPAWEQPRMPSAGRPVPNLAKTSPALPEPPSAGDELKAWIIGHAYSHPGQVIEIISERLTAEPCLINAGDAVDLWILRAEIQALAGDMPSAVTGCDTAADNAVALHPLDTSRLLTVLAVKADLLVRSGDSHAVTAAFVYMRECAQQPDNSDPRRFLTAAALCAVAQYQHVSCGKGRERMARLTATPSDFLDEPIVSMLHAAEVAMREGCTQLHREPAAGVIPPLPGGSLQPRTDLPDPRSLAWRVRCRPGKHDHAVALPESSGPQQ